MLWTNAKRRLIAASVQLSHADKLGVSNVAKSAYYRSAITLTSTVIEGLAYELVKRTIGQAPYIIETKREHRELQPLAQAVSGTSRSLCVCEKLPVDVLVDDSGVGFAKFNDFLKRKHVVNAGEHRVLNYIRIERNKIHIQGITFQDVGYTKRKFNLIARALPMLLKKF